MKHSHNLLQCLVEIYYVCSNYLLGKLDNLFESKNSSNGYIEFDNGIIIQWIQATISTLEPTIVNYPKPFKVGAYQLAISYDWTTPDYMYVGSTSGRDKNSCQAIARMIKGGTTQSAGMRIIAIGY